MFAKLAAWSVTGLVLALFAVSGFAMLQGRWLDDAVRERDEANRARRAAERTIIVMADQASENARSADERGKGRESIVASPPEEDGPVAPVLQRGFDAADRIGGIK